MRILKILISVSIAIVLLLLGEIFSSSVQQKGDRRVVFEETARVKSKNRLEIKLVKVEELLYGKFKI